MARGTRWYDFLVTDSFVWWQGLFWIFVSWYLGDRICYWLWICNVGPDLMMWVVDDNRFPGMTKIY